MTRIFHYYEREAGTPPGLPPCGTDFRHPDTTTEVFENVSCPECQTWWRESARSYLRSDAAECMQTSRLLRERRIAEAAGESQSDWLWVIENEIDERIRPRRNRRY